MTCPCHDPLVFGHLTCRGETQPWTQPPIAYGAGETFTILPGAIMNAISQGHLPPISFNTGGVIMPASEAGHAIRDHVPAHIQYLRRAAGTGWNWTELPETGPDQGNTQITNEPCP